MPGSQFFYSVKPIYLRRSFWAAPALPKFMSECGDVLLAEFVSDSVGAVLGPGPLMLLLCVQVRLIRVLKALSGAFMSSGVIFFSGVLGTGTMGVGSEVTALRRNLL